MMIFSSCRKASIKPSSNWVKCSRISNYFSTTSVAVLKHRKEDPLNHIPRQNAPKQKDHHPQFQVIFCVKVYNPVQCPHLVPQLPLVIRPFLGRKWKSVRQNLKLEDTKILTNGAFCVCWNTLWFDFPSEFGWYGLEDHNSPQYFYARSWDGINSNIIRALRNFSWNTETWSRFHHVGENFSLI